MASAYPGGLDSFATNKADATATATDHPAHHNDLADAVNKIEAELGIDPAGASATVKARLDSLDPIGTLPVNGDFAWVNQNSALLDVNARGHISLIAPNNAAGSLSCRVKAAPATPYTVTARLVIDILRADFHSAGLLFRESGTGEIAVFAYSHATGFHYVVQHWTNATTFSAGAASFDVGSPARWFRIADNGTNRLYSVSADGENFIEFFSEGRTTFLTADQIGFYANAQQNPGTIPVQVVVESWDEA